VHDIVCCTVAVAAALQRDIPKPPPPADEKPKKGRNYVFSDAWLEPINNLLAYIRVNFFCYSCKNYT
jgi:hypothetical protein